MSHAQITIVMRSGAHLHVKAPSDGTDADTNRSFDDIVAVLTAKTDELVDLELTSGAAWIRPSEVVYFEFVADD